MISAQVTEEVALFSPLHVDGAKDGVWRQNHQAASVTLAIGNTATILISLCHSLLRG